MKVLLGLIIFFASDIHAQKAIEIVYNQSYIQAIVYKKAGDTIGQVISIDLPKVRMLVNDSMAHIHYFEKGNDPYKNRKSSFGKIFLHHGQYLDFRNLAYYDEIHLIGLPKYLVQKSCDDELQWQVEINNTKKILGYKCTAALAINEKKDSVLVYFTNDLIFKKGFLYYEGVPGVVLESFDQRYDGRHIEALFIKEIQLKLEVPDYKKIISCEEYQAIIKKKK